jgi:hypothetical protein
VADASALATLGHLVLVTIVCAVVAVGSYLPDLWRGTQHFAAWWEKTVPVLEIRDDRLVADMAGPFDARYRQFHVLVDLAGNPDQPPASDAVGGFMVGAERVVVWSRHPDHPEASLSKMEVKASHFPPGRVDAGYIRSLVLGGAWFGVLAAVALIVGVTLGAVLLQACLFSAVAAFMDRSVGEGLRLRQYLNISLYAATPALLVVTTYVVMRLEMLIEHMGWVYLIVYGIFLIGGTNACRRQDDEIGEDSGTD